VLMRVYISRLECGAHKPQTLPRLVKALGVAPADLLRDGKT